MRRGLGLVELVGGLLRAAAATVAGRRRRRASCVVRRLRRGRSAVRPDCRRRPRESSGLVRRQRAATPWSHGGERRPRRRRSRTSTALSPVRERDEPEARELAFALALDVDRPDVDDRVADRDQLHVAPDHRRAALVEQRELLELISGSDSIASRPAPATARPAWLGHLVATSACRSCRRRTARDHERHESWSAVVPRPGTNGRRSTNSCSVSPGSCIVEVVAARSACPVAASVVLRPPSLPRSVVAVVAAVDRGRVRVGRRCPTANCLR